MKNERSPRYPFISLEESLIHLKALYAAADGGEELNREAFLSALGYASPHGAAMKTLAALRGYGLIERRPGRMKITELGLNLAGTGEPELKLSFLRRAALAPRMFRRIWRHARDLSAVEIEEMLLLRGFTEKGAERASEVYSANSQFARLDEIDIEPEPPAGRANRRGRLARGRESGGRRDGRIRGQGQGQARSEKPDGLSLPLTAGRAFIPSGLSEQDFEVLMQTLRIWKPRLMKEGSAE